LDDWRRIGELSVNALPRVLIIDRSAESREVLRTLLERRGVTALEADRPEHALLLAKDARPDLIVVDADSDLSLTGECVEDLCDAAGRTATPIVILGTLRGPRSQPAAEIVAKPYHYGALIRKIDDLLAAA
jgi:DNA-binding response OmpR family regulator